MQTRQCAKIHLQVYHSGPGNAYCQDYEPHHERQDVLHAQQHIKSKRVSHLQSFGHADFVPCIGLY